MDSVLALADIALKILLVRVAYMRVDAAASAFMKSSMIHEVPVSYLSLLTKFVYTVLIRSPGAINQVCEITVLMFLLCFTVAASFIVINHN